MSDVITPPSPEAPLATPARPSGLNLFGLISLVLAVLGFVAGVVPIASGFAWLFFVPAIVLAIIGLVRKGQPKRLALAGLLVAIVGWIVAIIVTVVTIVSGVGTALDDPLPDAPISVDGNGALGQPVTNTEGVAFTADAVQCGLTTTGSDFFDEVPNGEWCRIDYTIDNGGTSALSLLSGDITATAGGVTYAADDATGKFGADYFTTDVNPGLSVPCVVFLDVPVGTTLESVVYAPVLSFAAPVQVSVG